MARKKKDHDFSVNAYRIVQEATDPKTYELESALINGKNPYAVILDRRGGLKGGKSRAIKLTVEQRRDYSKSG